MDARLAQRLARRRFRDFAEGELPSDVPVSAAVQSAVVDPIAEAQHWSFGKAVVVGVTVSVVAHYAIRFINSLFGGRQ